jgi:N-acetylmuramoyl-L-alanine amidase
LRAPRPALIGGITLAIATTPVLAATVLAADPTVVVQPGDTLTGIGRRHGVSVQRLAALNNLANPSWIIAGQRLRIGRDRSGPSGPSSAPKASDSTRVHIVTPGSTLSHIALRYNVSVGAIVTANRIANPSRIFAGQRLVIPGGSAARQSGSRTEGSRSAGGGGSSRQEARVIHVVSRGSTLWHIALRYGVRVSAIVAANRLANPSLIFSGQRLVIPRTNGPAARVARTASRPRMSTSMANLVAGRSWVRGILVRQADHYRVPRSLVLAVAWQESGWQQNVVSHAGAIGVMQLMPGTADWIGQTMLDRPVRTHRAGSNIAAGVRLLRHYLDRYDGNLDLVLAAYYQGQRAVDIYGIYPVSRPYIASIRYLKRLFGG